MNQPWIYMYSPSRSPTISHFKVLWLAKCRLPPSLWSLLAAFFLWPVLCHLSDVYCQLIHHLTDLLTHPSSHHLRACPQALFPHTLAATHPDAPTACLSASQTGTVPESCEDLICQIIFFFFPY